MYYIRNDKYGIYAFLVLPESRIFLHVVYATGFVLLEKSEYRIVFCLFQVIHYVSARPVSVE